MSEPISDDVISPILVIGCGLLGTSVALAARALGTAVHLRDRDLKLVELVESLGGGTGAPIAHPRLVVVAVPPSAAVAVCEEALAEFPDAVVTDVSSVKEPIVSQIDSPRFVGGHPMAGKERSGPMAATAVLFDGRPWIVVPSATTSPETVALVSRFAETMGAVVKVFQAADHDEAVTLVSHIPHLMSVLTAGLLVDAKQEHVELAGQGIRDVTRVAASEPDLWTDIIALNPQRISGLLHRVRDRLDTLIDSVESGNGAVADVLAAGRAGTAKIPGKHGDRQTLLDSVVVPIADEPGQLSKLFAHAGETGVNVEDLRMEHELGRPVGLVRIAVLPERADELVTGLIKRGWSAHHEEGWL